MDCRAAYDDVVSGPTRTERGRRLGGRISLIRSRNRTSNTAGCRPLTELSFTRRRQAAKSLGRRWLKSLCVSAPSREVFVDTTPTLAASGTRSAPRDSNLRLLNAVLASLFPHRHAAEAHTTSRFGLVAAAHPQNFSDDF